MLTSGIIFESALGKFNWKAFLSAQYVPDISAENFKYSEFYGALDEGW